MLDAPELPWVRVEPRADGLYVTVRPGTPASALAETITQFLQSGRPGVDLAALQSAWQSPGIAVRVAGPAAPAPSPDTLFRTEEHDGEVFLTIDPAAVSATEHQLIPWLNTRDYSGIDIQLVLAALQGKRGVPHQITAWQPAKKAAGAPALTPAETALVADADDGRRTPTAESLKRRGLKVREARSADVAGFEARQRTPDLIVLSHPLGRADAIDVCSSLRSDPRTAEIPVMLVCPSPTRETVRRALAAGVREILVRPFAQLSFAQRAAAALKRVSKSLPTGPSDRRGAEAAACAAEESVKTLGKIDIAKLREHAVRLHAMPGVVEHVMRLSGDDESGARELAACVSSEPAVAASILRLANSAYFGAAGKAQDIPRAIVRLGFRQTRSIVVGMSMVRTFPKATRTAGFDRTCFWRHSISAAVLAKLLADGAGIAHAQHAFLAGLLHDVGKILLDELAPTDFAEAVLSAIQERIPLVDAEIKILRTDHARVGHTVLEGWRFPQALVTAVQHHHAPAAEGSGIAVEFRPLCGVTYVANLLAKAAGQGHGGDLSLEQPPDETWTGLRVDSGLPGTFWRRFAEEVRAFGEIAGVEEESPVRLARDGEIGILYEDRRPRVSILQCAIEGAGWVVSPISNPKAATATGNGRPAFAVARCRTAESLTACLQAWSSIPALQGVRVIGIVPRGVTPPPGAAVLVEPYDRSSLFELLGTGVSQDPPAEKPAS